MGCVFTLVFALLSFTACAQNIFIDEDVSDWNNSEITIYEEAGDNNRLDILSLAITNDVEYIYFKLEFDKEIKLQQDNNLTLEISNSEIDFEFNFGEREGRFGNSPFFQDNINLISSPTVSSRIFEVQISRKWDLGFGSSYTMSGEYQIALSNFDNNSDQLPNGNGTISYKLKDNISTAIPAYKLSKPQGTDFRFCTYNVLRDRIFESEARTAYSEILKTINPDVIIFQEIYDHTSNQTLTRLLNVFNALDNNAQWYSSDRGSDNIILSKYPIIYSREIAGNGIFVIEKDGIEIMIANVHLPCCERDSEREQEIDRILSFIRRSKAGEENFTLKPNSPIIISGDTNFVGNSDQVRAIRTGNIFDNGSDGPDFEIDWDSDGLADLKPYATGRNAMYTWKSNFSSFSAGRLDYIFYSDHSLSTLNSFVLDSEYLTDAERITSNVEKDYSLIASDHYPVVVDFKFNPVVPTKDISTLNFKIWPNPATEICHIDAALFDKNIDLKLYNYEGQLVRDIEKPQVDLSSLSNGLYFIVGSSQGLSISHRLVIAR